MVVNRETAENRGGLLFAVAQVRGLADEVLFLHPGRGHPGLDHVVLGLELVAVRAVGLLEPAGAAVHADATGRETVWTSGLPERVPQPETLLDRDVQLPAEVPDV